MTEDRDPLLQSLFTESQAVTTDDEFTESVMTKTYARRRKVIAAAVIASALLILYTLLFDAPLQEFVVLIVQFLSTELVDMGESWFALAVSPLNSVAGLMALLVKGFLILQKKLRLISF